MSKFKRVFKFFVVGQEDDECKWLAQMSKKGYHLVSIKLCMLYIFIKGESKEYAYVIDMKEGDSRFEEEYFDTYKDYGLDYIDTSAWFHYFRGDNIADIKEIVKNDKGRYIDRINKYKLVLFLVGVMNLIIFFTQMFNSYITKVDQFRAVSILNIIAGLLPILIILNINTKTKYLKKQGLYPIYKTKFKDWSIFLRFSIFVVIMTILFLVWNIIRYI